MKENEIYLNKTIDELNTKLKELEDSKEYWAGKTLSKTFLFKLLYSIKQKVKKKVPKDFILNQLNDFEYDYSNLEQKKIVIYSCITGEYDNIIEPEYCNPNIEYYLFTNNLKLKSNKWKIKYLENIDTLDNISLNRYVKMHPNLFLKEFDYSIYVDGNLKIVSDISCYINRINEKYGLALSVHSSRNKLSTELNACKVTKKGNIKNIKRAIKIFNDNGMPDNYGLLEAPVIATNLNNIEALKILDEWWNEFKKYETNRDQFILPYVLWKKNIAIEDIGTLSKNIWKEPKFTAMQHINK